MYGWLEKKGEKNWRYETDQNKNGKLVESKESIQKIRKMAASAANQEPYKKPYSVMVTAKLNVCKLGIS